MDFLWFVLGAGCLWHGVLVVWVAPRPSQLLEEKPTLEPGSPQAFQVFWLDQYAWMGVSLAILGLVLLLTGWL
ncbi:MAG: hypothetical protein AAF541_23100 [Pseudomonadota bacterium]